MKLDNRDLVLKGLLGVLPYHLEPYLRSVLGAQCTPKEVRSILGEESSVPPDLADPSVQIRILTARGRDGRYLLSLPPGLGSKLHEVRHFRNDAVHGQSFDADKALAALVAVSETLRLIGAEQGRIETRELINALDGGRGVRRNPLDAVTVEADCAGTLSYAHAVAAGRLSASIRLRLREQFAGSGRAADGVDGTTSAGPGGGGAVGEGQVLSLGRGAQTGLDDDGEAHLGGQVTGGEGVGPGDGVPSAADGPSAESPGPADVSGAPGLADASEAPGLEGPAAGSVEVRVVVVEDGGGHTVTEPWHLVWDTARLELSASQELRLDRISLLQVEQAGTAHLRVELRGQDGSQAVHRIPGLTVLPPRYWHLHPGRPSAGDALVTFVQPGQGAVEELVTQAGDLLAAQPGVSAMASGSGAVAPGPGVLASGPDDLVMAACTAIHRRHLTVDAARPWTAPCPVSAAEPLLDQHRGSTLDVAVLLAGVLEAMGVEPVLLLTPEAPLLGYGRRGNAVQPRTAPEVIDLVERGEMGLVDPALALSAPRSAAAVLREPTGELRELAVSAVSGLALVVPVSAARADGVAPQPRLERDDDDLVIEITEPQAPQPGPEASGSQPAASQPEPEAAQSHSPASQPEPEARPAPQTPPPAEVATPTQPEPGRPVPPAVEEWKRNLLDLSLRNPLIDCTTRHAISLKVPAHSVGVLEDIVNDRQIITLSPDPRTATRPAQARTAEEAARLLTEQREVRVPLTGEDYRRRLQSMAAQARTVVEETGANNLYLAVGTLVWRSGGRRLRSPLILVPVRLERADDAYGIVLDKTGVSTPNYSLLTRFAADTGIDLAELREPLRDELGFDIEATLETVRSRLRDCVHDAVVEHTVHLGLFQFATYRMWRDLEESWPTIVDNPVVGHLMDPGASSWLDAGSGADTGQDVDAVVENLPLEADAAQACVVADAVAGRSLVVEGPPGTGKSQTVANLVFRALATGRTVMFVAEKTSALDVVARRLKEAGIGDLLLDLHDNGRTPSAVRETLRKALEVRAEDDDVDPGALRAELAEIRGGLDSYRTALHGPGREGSSYYRARQALVEARDEHRSDAARAREAFEANARSSGLEDFDPAHHTGQLERYRDVRESLRKTLTPELLRVVVARREEVLRQAGQRAGELRREIRRRRGMSVRELMGSYGDLITALTPCLLVSPDSVARFFPPTRQYVDVVVFDEASQITVAGAVGAMGRGRSVVVVGDPKQMPPAGGSGVAEGADLEGGGPRRADSILDRCLAAGVTTRRLTWHYRSQVESLIAFSNRHYYDGALLTFPSPLALAPRADDGPGGHGVSLRRVEGTYVRTGTRKARSRDVANTNPYEASQVVDEVLRRFEASPVRVPSLGIITFNSRQRDLIESRLRERGSARVVAALEARDGLFVRNLENVQGEERDTILFSVTFSANERGDLPLTFGSLGHAGGHRRLNVAITRARRQVVVFTSFDPEDLHVERTTHQGLKDLRRYLTMARDGRTPRALPVSGSVMDRHRNEIAERLRDAGLDVRVGVGHSTFEIDLVVAVPEQAESPRLAVLLDGQGWNGRGSNADRDLLPVDVLRTMGWDRVERVWMPEWVADKREVVARIVEAAGGRSALRVGAADAGGAGGPGAGGAAEAAVSGVAAPGEGAPVIGQEEGDGRAPSSGPVTEPAEPGPEVAAVRSSSSDEAASGEAPAGVAAMFGPTEYRAWQPEGVRSVSVLNRAGSDDEARAQVVEVARAVCDVESPITRHRLIVKICRAFGLSRTTAQREEKVRLALGEAFAYVDEHDFVWRSMDARAVAPPYRRNALDYVDSIKEIHPDELTALMAEVLRESNGSLSPDDQCTKALRRLSVKKRRLSACGVWPALRSALERAEAQLP